MVKKRLRTPAIGKPPGVSQVKVLLWLWMKTLQNQILTNQGYLNVAALGLGVADGHLNQCTPRFSPSLVAFIQTFQYLAR